MGVLPLQFPAGATRKTLELRGDEIIDISGVPAPRGELDCTITRADGSSERLKLLSRLDTRRDVEYFRHGGLLHYVLRHRLSNERAA
jgi:aconitate hydratase